jgi:hypothetical protein
MTKDLSTLPESTVQSAVNPAHPTQVLMSLKLSPAQRSTVLEYAELSDELAIRIKDPAVNEFTLDELDCLLDELEMAFYRVKGNEKQKVQRIGANVEKLLGSDIDAADFPRRRAAKGDGVFQIKITMCGIRPLIWRRIQTRDCSLADLHELIQIAMGWEFDHCYRFEIGGVEFMDERVDIDVRDANKTTLSQVLPDGQRRPRFHYVYDFGDEWVHQLIVEERLAPQEGAAYPVCVGGARACPPEDCGGAPGYYHILEAIENPKDCDQEWFQIFAAGFDPAAFDVKGVNKILAPLTKKKKKGRPSARARTIAIVPPSAEMSGPAENSELKEGLPDWREDGW